MKSLTIVLRPAARNLGIPDIQPPLPPVARTWQWRATLGIFCAQPVAQHLPQVLAAQSFAPIGPRATKVARLRVCGVGVSPALPLALFPSLQPPAAVRRRSPDLADSPTDGLPAARPG